MDTRERYVAWQAAGVRRAVCAFVVAIALSLTWPASAHETKQVGALTMTIGWGEEPAYSGLTNSIDVTFANADAMPVVDAAGALTVEIAFGTERNTVSLLPGGRPGLYQAKFVPTRSGTYSFRVAGKIAGLAIDTTSTCSSQSFDCVTDVAAIQFPAKDPASGELLTRLDREQARADRSARNAKNAVRIAVAAVAVAVVALVVAARRGRRAS
ncbi:MAG TPA: hypothetical protein VFB78_18320 [Acidimicrobiales bacterium]|nr:hypothetical protein [Acidimicrobiales bacterium]